MCLLLAAFFSVELRGMALLPLFSMLFSLPFPSHLVKIIKGFQNVFPLTL